MKEKDLCYFTSVCDEDVRFLPRYLDDCARLGIPFCMHFDRCVFPEWELARNHHLCRGVTFQSDPTIEFNEMHKQAVLDTVNRLGYRWACAMDIDETWERDALPKMEQIVNGREDYWNIRWLNLWGSQDFVRIDRHYGCGHRTKFLALDHGFRWVFEHKVVNGPKAKTTPYVEPRLGKMHNLVCLHWGMMTEEDRLFHKQRWDRIYTKAAGNNPYGFWDDALDPTIEPLLARHDYL